MKMRGSDHSRNLRAYQVTSQELELGETLHEYRGIITGVPELRAGAREPRQPELTALESRVLGLILGLGESSADAVARDGGLKLEELTQGTRPSRGRQLREGHGARWPDALSRDRQGGSFARPLTRVGPPRDAGVAEEVAA